MISNSISISLVNKVALVTGASSGLGRHFAKVLATAGADVILAARRINLLEDAAREVEELGRKAYVLPLDLTDCDAIKVAIPKIWKQVGRIDILVNNAGNIVRKPSQKYTTEDWDSIFNTHVRGCWTATLETANLMVTHQIQGSIINISSAMSYRTRRNALAYPSAKAALNHLTRSLALEYSQYNIRVNAIAPGWFITEMTKEFLATSEGKQQLQYIPFKRAGEFQELDGPLLLLASDASSYMTGAILPIDGGCVACALD